MAKKKNNKIFPDNSKLLYLSLVTFVYIVSCCLALSNGPVEVRGFVMGVKDKMSEAPTARSFIPNPVLKEGSEPFPIISAQAVLALDLNSRVPLYEKNPDLKLLPASTTKIVTALVAMEAYKMDDVLIVGKNFVEGQKMGLMVGEKISAGNLIQGLLVASANDAAETLAANYPGGRESFIAAMNQKAAQLSLNNTHFDNPVGFDGANQISTAKDLILVAEIAMQNPSFAATVKQKEGVIASIDGKITHKLVSTNKLLGENGVLGVKTGWTENARENLVTYLDRDGRKIMIALLGSQDRFGETKEIINWIYRNYEWQEVKYPED